MAAPAKRSMISFVARCCIFLAAAAAWPESEVQAQEVVYDEHRVKAAFIYHFSTFVVWPDATQTGRDFVIAVLGDDDVARELAAYLPGHSLQGRPMRARRIASVDELGDDDILFIGSGRERDLTNSLKAVADRPVLLVTDAPGALAKGSMINFNIVDDRVRFEIALRTAERAGLTLSSRLLSAAMFVDTTSAVRDPPTRVLASSGHSPRFY
jgi:hypothetical protein